MSGFKQSGDATGREKTIRTNIAHGTNCFAGFSGISASLIILTSTPRYLQQIDWYQIKNKRVIS